MAKNTIEIKKRVARVQTMGENSECEFHDYVSDIIKNMDSSFKTVQPNNFKTSPLEAKNCNSSGHENGMHSTTPCKESVNSMKRKKFIMARKFPLMEKSQKILKHIRHNQSIPKQRAHLASISHSPKKKIPLEVDSIKEKTIKRGNSNVIKNKVPSKISKIAPRDTNSAYPSSNLNNKSSSICKKTKASSKKSKQYKCNKEISCRKNGLKNATSSTNDSINMLGTVDDYFDNNNVGITNHSNDSTSDSEYERFVQSNKKHLKKKCGKQKTSNKNTKVSKRGQKRVKKNTALPKLPIDSSDDDLPTRNYKSKRNKLNIMSSDSEEEIKSHPKVKQKCTTLLSDSQNVTIDEEVGNCFQPDEIISDPKVKQKCTTLLSNSENVIIVEEAGNCFQPNDLKSNQKRDTLLSESENEIINDEPGTCFEPSDSDTSGKGVESKATDMSKNVIESEDSAEESELEIVHVIRPKLVNPYFRNTVHNINDVSDSHTLRDSDTFKEVKINEVNPYSVESKNLCTNQIRPETGDENQNKKCDFKHQSTSVKDIRSNHSKKASSKQPESDKDANAHNRLSVDSVSLIQSSTEIKIESDDDDDIIIIDSYNIDKFHGNASNSLKFNGNASNVSFAEDKLSKVKTEKTNIHCTTNDTKYFVDSNSTTNSIVIKNEKSLSSTNDTKKGVSDYKCLQTLKKESIAKDLDLLKVAHSNLVHAESLHPKISNELKATMQQHECKEENIDVKHLLNLFKEEFKIYQNIVQTEANVEASLKLLESNQAEKLKSIRSLIQKHLEGKQYINHPNNSKIHEQLNLIGNSTKINLKDEHKISPKAIPDFKKTFSEKTELNQGVADIFVKGFDSNQSAVLYDRERDVKPDLSLLHLTNNIPFQHSTSRIKKESIEVPQSSSTSALNTKKLLGEKCNVCGKAAMAACQRCAKVFFCSNECGKQYWDDGHAYECGK